MVTHWGMSDRLGPMSFRVGEEHVFLGKEIQEPRDFSEGTAEDHRRGGAAAAARGGSACLRTARKTPARAGPFGRGLAAARGAVARRNRPAPPREQHRRRRRCDRGSICSECAEIVICTVSRESFATAAPGAMPTALRGHACDREASGTNNSRQRLPIRLNGTSPRPSIIGGSGPGPSSCQAVRSDFKRQHIASTRWTDRNQAQSRSPAHAKPWARQPVGWCGCSTCPTLRCNHSPSTMATAHQGWSRACDRAAALAKPSRRRRNCLKAERTRINVQYRLFLPPLFLPESCKIGIYGLQVHKMP